MFGMKNDLWDMDMETIVGRRETMNIHVYW